MPRTQRMRASRRKPGCRPPPIAAPPEAGAGQHRPGMPSPHRLCCQQASDPSRRSAPPPDRGRLDLGEPSVGTSSRLCSWQSAGAAHRTALPNEPQALHGARQIRRTAAFGPRPQRTAPRPGRLRRLPKQRRGFAAPPPARPHVSGRRRAASPCPRAPPAPVPRTWPQQRPRGLAAFPSAGRSSLQGQGGGSRPRRSRFRTLRPPPCPARL
mmetsp:Transcript_11708/g.22262  ORF Transcript_11708/g.22262 Transcript_11708/m.22262 type:complete len:211 (+) Transcript_11708:242-874(+)